MSDDRFNRARDYKKTGGDGRERRRDQAASLRKKKREDAVRKRRTMITMSQPVSKDPITDVITRVMTGDLETTVRAVAEIRGRLTSVSGEPDEDGFVDGNDQELFAMCETLVNAGIIERFRLIFEQDSPVAHRNATWILTTISIYDSLMPAVISIAGAVATLMMRTTALDVRFECLCMFSNMAIDENSVESCAQSGLFQAVVNLALTGPDDQTMIVACEIIFTMLRSRSIPKNEATVRAVIPVIESALERTGRTNDMGVGLVYGLCAGGTEVKAFLLRNTRFITELMPRVLISERDRARVFATKVFCSLTYEDDPAFSQVLFDLGVIPPLCQAFMPNSKGSYSTQIESIRAISNLCLGSPEQVASVIQFPIFKALHDLALASHNAIAVEACYVFASLLHATHSKQVYEAAIKMRAIPVLHHAIRSTDSALIYRALVSLKTILKTMYGDDVREQCELLGTSEVVDILVFTSDDRVSGMATTVVDLLSQEDEEVLDLGQGLTTPGNNGVPFQF